MNKGSRMASTAFFLFLLPLFFALHGLRENSDAMRFSEAVSITVWYTAVALGFAVLAYLFFRSFRKAALFAFCIVFFQLFFGPAHDALKASFPNSFLVQYSFLLPLALVTFVSLLIFLKRSQKEFHSLSLYLNVLFLLLVLLELPGLLKAASKPNGFVPLTGTSVCDTCHKPDIYFIVADEYADSISLQQIFGFNNGAFQKALRDRGFHLVNNSRSNYNFTSFSVASLLGMNYLSGLEGRNQSFRDKNICYEVINKSGLWNLLQRHGYDIKNHSVFNVANIPTEAPQNYILIGKDLVQAQTFTSRLDRDLRYHLAVTFKFQSEVDRVLYYMKRCNDKLVNGLLQEPAKKSAKPKFVYAHITMPHYPYYYRKDGTANPPEMLWEGNQTRKAEYIEYLQYSNNVFLKTLDSILQQSKTPPVIVFMGDHGFREFTDGFEKNARYYYMNLNAVLLPKANYAAFYNGITGVNQFRALLNTVFNQKLPYLQDSTILLYE